MRVETVDLVSNVICKSASLILILSLLLPVQDHSESPLLDPSCIVRLVSEDGQTHQRHLTRETL